MTFCDRCESPNVEFIGKFSLEIFWREPARVPKRVELNTKISQHYNLCGDCVEILMRDFLQHRETINGSAIEDLTE